MVKATINTANESNISVIPPSTPGVPSEIDCGGYNVHPAPVGPPSTKNEAINIITESKKNQ